MYSRLTTVVIYDKKELVYTSTRVCSRGIGTESYTYNEFSRLRNSYLNLPLPAQARMMAWWVIQIAGRTYISVAIHAQLPVVPRTLTRANTISK